MKSLPASATPNQDAAAAIGIRKILVPVDFSEAGKPALQYAKSLARITGASIHLVHVMDIIYHTDGSYGSPEYSYIQLDTPRMREVVTRKIGALQVGAFKGFKTTFEIRDGITHSEINKAVKSSKADLVVMATHGYTGLQHILLGSTTERVVRHADCPVLVVRSKFAKGATKRPSRRKTAVTH